MTKPQRYRVPREILELFFIKQFNLTSKVQVNGQIWGSYSSVLRGRGIRRDAAAGSDATAAAAALTNERLLLASKSWWHKRQVPDRPRAK